MTGLTPTYEINNLISQHVPIKEFYSEYVGEFEFSKNVRCPFHQDNTPSFKINEDGSFKCFSAHCGKSGGGPAAFLYEMYSPKKAAAIVKKLYSKHVELIIPDSTVKYHKAKLLSDERLLKRLKRERGFRELTLKTFNIGWTENGARLLIPVENRFGWVTSAYYHNIFDTPGYVKTMSYKQGAPTGYVWPLQILQKKDDVLFCEGQPDTLCALSYGINAITIGSATNTIKKCELPYFRNKNITICYDTDDPGKAGASRIANQLIASGLPASVKVLKLIHRYPERHNDLTDWLHKEGRTREDLFELIKKAKKVETASRKTLTQQRLVDALNEQKENAPEFLNIYRISDAGQKGIWQTEAVATTKTIHSYLYPKIVCVRCSGKIGNKCQGCLLDNEDRSYFETLDPSDEWTMKFYLEKEKLRPALMRRKLGISRACYLEMTTEESYKAHQLIITAPLDYQNTDKDEPGEALQIEAYYFGQYIRLNVPYLFTGYTMADPENSSCIAVLLDGKPIASTLDSFTVTKEVRENLTPFQYSYDEDLYECLLGFYEHVAESITGIKDRPLSHMAIDLAFFSPVSFRFNEEYHRKGALDILVFGDTRCGKNAISERLQRYYQHGEVISGENVSFMNLVGGIKILPKYRTVCWGRFVARHRDIVIVDEMTGIKKDDFGNLSRLRSEGVAEINKDGLSQSADACCATIFISNPIKGSLQDYDTGMDAFLRLVEKDEDRSRFDYIVAMERGEVSADRINEHIKERPHHRFTSEQCHQLILWVKSRKPDEIKFTYDAETYLLKQAVEVAKKYHVAGSLVQHENMRVKLAKIAASIAGRIWSTDASGEKLIIDIRCAEAAVRMLHDLYSGPPLAYDSFSKKMKRYDEIDNKAVVSIVREFADLTKKPYNQLCDQISLMKTIRIQDMEIMMENSSDRYLAHRFLKSLLFKHCLQSTNYGYEIMPGFRNLLKRERRVPA